MCDGRACRLFLFLLRSIENRENRGQTERFLMKTGDRRNVF